MVGDTAYNKSQLSDSHSANSGDPTSKNRFQNKSKRQALPTSIVNTAMYSLFNKETGIKQPDYDKSHGSRPEEESKGDKSFSRSHNSFISNAPSRGGPDEEFL